MIQKCIVAVKFCLVLMLLMAVDKGFAEMDVQKHQINPIGDNTVVFGNYKINISNGENSSVSIYSNDSLIEEWVDEFAGVTKVYTWIKDEKHYFLLENTISGTGSFTRFVIFELIDDEMKRVFLSNDYQAGSIDMVENRIEVTYLDSNGNHLESNNFLKDLYVQNDEGTISLTEQGIKANVKMNSSPQELFSFQSTGAEDDLKGENPTTSELNNLLTQEALKAGIPPEIIKAIAWQESSWRQYRTNDDPNGTWEKGDPIVSFDGGIGIMQITEPNMTADRAVRLKTDIVYNIQEGIRILKDKWTYSNWGRIPQINGNDMQIMEDWYFAIMAYNGISRRNDPQYYPNNTYQDVIYSHIERYSQMVTTAFPVQLLRDDIYYTNSGSLQFRKPHYHVNGPYQTSKHLFNNGDIVKATESGVRLRTSPEGTEVRKTLAGEALQIVGAYQAGTNNSNHFVWYPVKDMHSNETYYIASSYLENMRISGVNRYATAVSISRAGWDKSEVVVLARGDNFPDALAGTPLAYQLNAPILLTKSNELVEETKQELLRLDAKKIIILGGSSAITPGVEKIIRDLGIEVERIAGTTRFETAKLIANKMGKSFSTVVVTNGYGFPDALAIAPYAARNGIPILLTEKSYIPGPTKTLLTNASNTIVVGGTSVVSNHLLKLMPKAVRVSGSTRYETAYKIGTEFNFSSNTGLVVNGHDFPDALTGSVLAAKLNAPLLLVNPSYLPVETQNLVDAKGFNQLSVLGGTAAVKNDSVLKLVK
ncbi:cell wall-binding repeat-containing protein [Bacillus haimaensis]|uniref:cell wall-binding repeat-containing protein n=1 Tax=Bacillus haimaensis TaxID=3160967 RepID=UPI003AA9DE6F